MVGKNKFLVLVLIILSLFVSACGGSKPTQPKISKIVTDLQKEVGVPEEQAKTIEAILLGCEIKSYDSIKPNPDINSIYNDMYNTEGGKVYRLKQVNSIKGEDALLFLKDNKVVALRFAQSALYENGKTINKVSDFVFNISEMTDLQLRCEKGITSLLKSPSSAKFPGISDWKFAKNRERVVVASYVDSQNSFGAMIRSSFQVTFSADKSKVISLIFDGKEIMP